ADDPPRTNANPRFLQVANSLDAILVGVGGAVIGKESAGTLQVMAIALQPRLFQTIGDGLTFDNSKGSIRARLAALSEVANALTDFIEHRPFLQAAPRCDQTDGGHAVAIGFLGGFEDWFRFDETITR